jgi:predicted GIY-YIG superfamily endonuclease
MRFHYIYILQSETDTERFYVGYTEDLQGRLKAHNQKKCRHTSKDIPWKIKTAIAFTDEKKSSGF